MCDSGTESWGEPGCLSSDEGGVPSGVRACCSGTHGELECVFLSGVSAVVNLDVDITVEI